MKYTLQIDGTNPKNWREIEAANKEAAIIIAIRPLINKGQNPEVAYVALGETRHQNGAPLCVQSYKLKVDRRQIKEEARQ